MINEPVRVVNDNFQYAWVEVVKNLMVSRWELRNLIVHIRNPRVLDQPFHDKVEDIHQGAGTSRPQACGLHDIPPSVVPGRTGLDGSCALPTTSQGGFLRGCNAGSLAGVPTSEG